MDTTSVTELAQDLPELTEAELATVVGGIDPVRRVESVKAFATGGGGMCECGFAH